jgi:hypothetical protein
MPWRFRPAALVEVLRPLAPAPLPETLEDSVQWISCPLAEETVIDDLVADLRSAAR